MGRFREYDNYDGLGLAELIVRGEVTPTEVCLEARQRIEEAEPGLGAVIHPMFDQARQNLAHPLPEGPFAGVPIVVKDLMYACAGTPLSDGCKALRNRISDHDSEMVTRLRATGAVIMGKTNTPEFGLLGITEPELFGPCRNPWNPDHTPGGSSGGSAAAVAAGLVPLAGGGDGGGSIRIPAAYCGLFGLKPSRGRNPSGPDHGRVWQGAVQEHVLTRSVRDSAAMLDATAGADPGAPYEIKPPAGSYLEEVDRDPGKLRIAFTTTSPLGTAVDPECAAAVEGTASLLEEMGHRVEERTPDIDGRELALAYLTLYFGETAADIDALEAELGRKAAPGDVEPLTWTLALLGRSFSAGQMVASLRVWDRAARAMGRFFGSHDIHLTPTTARTQARIGELQPRGAEAVLIRTINKLRAGWLLKASGLVDKMAEKSLERTPFTQLANLTGLPAMSVPLHWTPDGLPLGCQFIAPFGAEDVLFRLAGQLERARPWFEKRPPALPA